MGVVAPKVKWTREELEKIFYSDHLLPGCEVCGATPVVMHARLIPHGQRCVEDVASREWFCSKHLPQT
jgi:hypothetical protein